MSWKKFTSRKKIEKTDVNIPVTDEGTKDAVPAGQESHTESEEHTTAPGPAATAEVNGETTPPEPETEPAVEAKEAVRGNVEFTEKDYPVFRIDAGTDAFRSLMGLERIDSRKKFYEFGAWHLEAVLKSVAELPGWLEKNAVQGTEKDYYLFLPSRFNKKAGIGREIPAVIPSLNAPANFYKYGWTVLCLGDLRYEVELDGKKHDIVINSVLYDRNPYNPCGAIVYESDNPGTKMSLAELCRAMVWQVPEIEFVFLTSGQEKAPLAGRYTFITNKAKNTQKLSSSLRPDSYEYLVAGNNVRSIADMNKKTERLGKQYAKLAKDYEKLLDKLNEAKSEVCPAPGSNISQIMGDMREMILAAINKSNTAIDSLSQKMDSYHDEYIDRFDNVDDALKALAEQVAANIAEAKAKVSAILEKTSDPDAKEAVINDYGNTVSRETAEQYRSELVKDRYDRTEKELIEYFEDDTWKRFAPGTKLSLITAQLTYDDFVSLGDRAEYSGVVILIIKALEEELKKRFFEDYRDFIKERSDWTRDNWDLPEGLTKVVVDRYSGPRREEREDCEFTFGSLACIFDDINKSPDSLQYIFLRDYCYNVLCRPKHKNMSDNIRFVSELATKVRYLNNHYRIPAAHVARTLNRADADGCREVIITGQELLKKVMEYFK